MDLTIIFLNIFLKCLFYSYFLIILMFLLISIFTGIPMKSQILRSQGKVMMDPLSLLDFPEALGKPINVMIY